MYIVRLKPYNDLSGSHEELRARSYRSDSWLLKDKSGLYRWGERGYGLAIFDSVAEAHSALGRLTKESVLLAKEQGAKIYIVPPKPETPPDVLFDGNISSGE